MRISTKGLDLIKSFESLRLKAYKCPAGVWTIGYGHTEGVTRGMVITEEQAEVFLRNDLSDAELAVQRTNIPFNQNQFDALVSFVFNIGISAFHRSTLLRIARINPNNPLIRHEFLRWNKANGKVLVGLTNRRIKEFTLYFTD